MIPDVEFLKSSPMTHKYGDLFSPPAAVNTLGGVQAALDLTGIFNLNFPPFAMSENHTADLFLNHRYFKATGQPVTFTWYPDRVIREASWQELYLRSTTALVTGERALILALEIENRSGHEREIHVRFGLQGAITHAVKNWSEPSPPFEKDNRVEIIKDRKAIMYEARHSRAVQVQGGVPVADAIVSEGLEYNLKLAPGQKRTVHVIIAIAAGKSEALALYDRIAAAPAAELEKTKTYWNDELKAVFTPGNDRFSGSLPELHTKEEDILKLYTLGALGVVYFKRDIPESVYGRAYETLLPRYWQTVTFIWDYALSSFVHALLDPKVMKKYIETWMHLDIHKHFGTEYLTGGPVGYWYSANDFNMMTLINDYVRWTGDLEWLEKDVRDVHTGASKRVIDYIEQYATGWHTFKSSSGLADYGEIDNLLECVSTYIHEVASLNAANVFNMRTAADILDRAGYTGKGKMLRGQSGELLREVKKLYAEGRGYWYTRFPDGSMVDVRHCYDFFTILNTIGDDLSEKQKHEMIAFFQKEFQTETWMRALAPSDNNAMFSVRPDHQWNGAYPAWPAHSLKALFKAGQTDLAYTWMKGLAKSFNQGPLGQGHFVEDVYDPEAGGALKAPSEMPYITDWACSGGGSWVSVILESLFGIRVQPGGDISAHPQFGPFDPKAELTNLMFQDNLYKVTKQGITKG